jgi:hypothetical protein
MVCLQGHDQITQAVPIGQLSESHYRKLVPAGKILDIAITVVFDRKAIKYTFGQNTDDLRENILTLIHTYLILSMENKVNSNRHAVKQSSTPRET